MGIVGLLRLLRVAEGSSNGATVCRARRTPVAFTALEIDFFERGLEPSGLVTDAIDDGETTAPMWRPAASASSGRKAE